MNRRRVLAIAATAGVGVSVAGVAGLSLAGESGGEAPKGAGPLVLSLRDAEKGTFDVFVGGSKSTLTDKKLAAKLLKSAKG
ncbi:hypothetical protein OWR29_16920 [Actinoplanes sp. Pm04-4]|uniref:Uncharacterized protein n=1 Tax=Paractinoplanes pyxinae TaxID=2997416 RepID=A0ABT4AZN3_9ACTN|nr:hypothetical protein [Actinoplanes pyxinae]MCY1139685.1 hypothetical protein [Actinoplanes pyxinae]